MMKHKLNCPKCSHPLDVAIEGECEVDVCPSCRGIWVDLAEEKEVLQIQPQVFSVDELRKLRSVYEPLGKTEPARYVPCPLCHEMMNRRVWGKHSGVVVDKCSKHGTWYDEGEIEKIREYISVGGIEFEKLRLTERGLNDVNSKLVTEIGRVDRKIDSAYMRARLFSLMGF
ncbi:MAG TPA: zf-TFIIB domain-containing protein [Candidatus Omnitrophota bacterium]|nr:hypothetical protein [Candidatus Omnitrophota bacterium]HRK60925.1 zf-TFIIB domain-containing protein [Candidatus Omnitrophota bacterium]